MKLHAKLKQFLTLKKKQKKFKLICFNPDVHQAHQRRLFSGDMSAMFLIVYKRISVINTIFFW